MLKFKVNIGKKGRIEEIESVEYHPRESSVKKKYYEILRTTICECFKNEFDKSAPKFAEWGRCGRKNTVWAKYAPEIIREFKEKYKEEYEKGCKAYTNNDEDTLQMILGFLRERLEIKFTGEPKKHFEFKLK